MRAGRASIGAEEVKRVTISRWADEGEKFLRDRFSDSGLKFHTAWDTKAGTITLIVHRAVEKIVRRGILAEPYTYVNDVKLFEETCPAENFVSYLMVTKIMMVM